MLRRFDWIRDGGFFDDFCWDPSLPDFKRINVIYGNNGSGKSSIARVLDGLRSTADGHQQVSITVEDDGDCRTTNGQTDPVFDRVLVFSEEYVARSHRFQDGSAEMDAVLTLGQRTAEDEERLDRLRAEQGTLTSERARLSGALRDVERGLEQAYGRASRAVVDDLSSLRGIYASRGTYSIARARTRLGDLRHQLATLLPADLAAKRQLISGGNRELLPTSDFSLIVRGDIMDTAKRLLAMTPLTMVLDTLETHPLASGWVQEGARLHKDSSTCAFCGGPLSDDRKAKIQAHFSDEVEQLQRQLGDLELELVKAEAEAESVAQRIPAGGLLFDDLRQEFELNAQATKGQVVAFIEWSAEVRAALTLKRANVLVAVEQDLSAPPGIDGAALVVARDEHNRRVVTHAQLVQEAAQAIELHHLKSEEGQVADLLARQGALTESLADIEARLGELAIEIPGLETTEGDPTPSAQVLTREVARLLGRSELRFEPSGKRYRVLRDGSPATGLSVGERTAVTLVHFLETVACFDTAAGRPIVVIDDPVSSLDSNVFMGISTYIWSAAISLTKDQVGQLFLLTHNFELFRQWDIQLEGLHRVRNVFPSELFELRSRHFNVAGSPRRRPVLAKWPETPMVRKKMRSSYHHAFLLMARAHAALTNDDTLENRLDAQLLFPNLIRRVLESFLAFKRPDQVGDFTGAMRETTAMLEGAGYAGDAEALRQQLTRYTHAYSHNESPDTNDVVNPDEIASALGAVFAFMRQLDAGHFCGLCDVVGVEPDVLVPPVSEDTESPT